MPHLCTFSLNKKCKYPKLQTKLFSNYFANTFCVNKIICITNCLLKTCSRVGEKNCEYQNIKAILEKLCCTWNQATDKRDFHSDSILIKWSFVRGCESQCFTRVNEAMIRCGKLTVRVLEVYSFINQSKVSDYLSWFWETGMNSCYVSL